MDRTGLAAFAVLRPSSRRLLQFIEQEIARQGGGAVVLLYASCGAARSLAGLGWIEWQRLPKRHLISRSDRWRDITTTKQAKAVSACARRQPMPPLPSPSQPASDSA